MRFIALAAVALGCALGVGCGGDGDEFTKAGLLENVEVQFEDAGMPTKMTDCIIDRFDAALDGATFERARGLLSDASEPSNGEIAKALGPRADRALNRGATQCALALLKSGQVSKAELRAISDALSEQ